MNLKQFWRRFWSRSYIESKGEYVTVLRASAPTVTRHEMNKLARKWKAQPPVNFGELGVLE